MWCEGVCGVGVGGVCSSCMMCDTAWQCSVVTGYKGPLPTLTLPQRYFDTAEKDKERYMREYSAYQQTESYKQFMKSKYPGRTRPANPLGEMV